MADGPRLNNVDCKTMSAIEFGVEAIEASRVHGVGVTNGEPGQPSSSSSSSSASGRDARAAMTRPGDRDPRPSHYPGEFSARVHRDWVRAKDPNEVVTEDLPPHVRTIMARPSYLNMRMGSLTPQFTWSWVFEVLSDGKPLRNIALALDDHRDNYFIKSVTGERGQRLGTCDRHEWFDSTSGASAVSQQESEADALPAYFYTVEIAFGANAFGTYRQHLLFGFGGYPTIRRRLCVDCVHFEDLKRLDDATKYVLQQNSHAWTSTEAGGVVHPFESPFVLAKDPREEYLTKAYPYPTENDFILSHATLTEDTINPNNYRGRMNELITVEELARHEQVARYNRVAQLTLSSSYILSSDTDGSTTAKYAPPGELFAEVGIDGFFFSYLLLFVFVC